MEKLFRGLVAFRHEDFEKHRELFEQLGRKQQPHTLFITCCDSRVVPNLITRSEPGELFIVRNIANMVPPYRASADYASTTAAIEYAVNVLQVESIVVCGHSNCGGCAAMNRPAEELTHLPHLSRWLQVSTGIREWVAALRQDGSPAEEEWLTEQANVVMQLKNLLTYPEVRKRCEAKKLELYGWHYIIETGEIFNYNEATGGFELVA